MSQQTHTLDEGPWNPGLQSAVPGAYRPLSSLFKSESIANSLREIDELSGFCGLPPEELVEFRARRLVEHEVLIRMTADVEVADGPNYEDLGLTFRAMVRSILEKHIAPHDAACTALLQEMKAQAKSCILSHLQPERTQSPRTISERQPSRLAAFWKRSAPARNAPPGRTADRDDLSRLAIWQTELEKTEPALEKECLRALVFVATAIAGRHGRLVGDPDLIAELAARRVCNSHGSAEIGRRIQDAFTEGVRAEGFRLLPAQEHPYVMNIKGASASGKSTMRPLQRALAARLGIPWSDFSLISPDIWRKFLLSYEGLGPAFKYAGALSAQELEIVDRKLDRYIAEKAASGRLTHLLIDRFRFDSFIAEADVEVSSKLLTRFGSHVFLHFMITPPEATVERAWERGKRVGRYKAVDDLLAHNIEAYSGMPELFFTWALARKKRVHYEFLDNTVPYGQSPRTIAFGINGEMNILDVACMLNFERYKNIDVNARNPGEVYLPAARNTFGNLAFLQRCIDLLPAVNLADRRTGEIYARFEQGQLAFACLEAAQAANTEEAARETVEALLERAPATRGREMAPPRLDAASAHTIGIWGPPGA